MNIVLLNTTTGFVWDWWYGLLHYQSRTYSTIELAAEAMQAGDVVFYEYGTLAPHNQ